MLWPRCDHMRLLARVRGTNAVCRAIDRLESLSGRSIGSGPRGHSLVGSGGLEDLLSCGDRHLDGCPAALLRRAWRVRRDEPTPRTTAGARCSNRGQGPGRRDTPRDPRVRCTKARESHFGDDAPLGVGVERPDCSVRLTWNYRCALCDRGIQDGDAEYVPAAVFCCDNATGIYQPR
jgi:hypothetical protein